MHFSRRCIFIAIIVPPKLEVLGLVMVDFSLRIGRDIGAESLKIQPATASQVGSALSKMASVSSRSGLATGAASV